MKGLSPATKELLYPLLSWPDIQSRWQGDKDTVARIRAVGETGEPYAIPYLLSYAFATNHDVRVGARKAIRALYERMPLEQLPLLDEALRQGWGTIEGWYGLKPTVKQLRQRDVEDLVLLALMASHRSGYVRAEAIRSLGQTSPEFAIPFVLVRLTDWVEPVRRAADMELIEKVQPEYADTFIRCLGLLERLSESSRFLRGYRDTVEDLLSRPVCARNVTAGLNSSSRSVRRACYRIATSNPAMEKREILDRALGEADVVIRSWAFASGPILRNEIGVDWIGLARKDTYGPIRWRAFDVLLRREASPEQISSFLFDPSTGVRAACQAVFTHRFGLDPVQTYREALFGGNSKRVEVTARGLGETGTSEDGPRLQGLLNHHSARVRSAAIRALSVLNVEQIDTQLLNVISSDRRSVAREAASVLLSRKAVHPTVIWAAAKENPNEHVRGAVLRQMWRAAKWVQLRLYLDSLVTCDAEISQCAIERLKIWEGQFNRSFVQPSQGELSELDDLLQRARSHVPADLWKRVAFIVRSF